MQQRPPRPHHHPTYARSIISSIIPSIIRAPCSPWSQAPGPALFRTPWISINRGSPWSPVSYRPSAPTGGLRPPARLRSPPLGPPVSCAQRLAPRSAGASDRRPTNPTRAVASDRPWSFLLAGHPSTSLVLAAGALLRAINGRSAWRYATTPCRVFSRALSPWGFRQAQR